MIKITFITIILLSFFGCSFKSPVNDWQYKSVNAFDSYTQNFLSLNNTLAKDDLNRAIKHAKKSANFTTLARIYLGECALNISVGLNDRCEKYQDIKSIVNDNYLESYYNLITLNLDKVQLSSLNNSYQNFTKSLIAKDFKDATYQIWQMDKTSSKLLAASLIKKNLM